MRPFIVIGDRSNHGGIVVGSSQTTDTHGNAWPESVIKSRVQERARSYCDRHR